MAKKRKLLVIGWDAADWIIINDLINKGQMPTFKKLISDGVSGNIATLEPPFSPMLWTTIATGVYPDKHGILGFSEPTPNKVGVRPVSSSSRKTKALWNILSHKNLKTHVVGWWPSNPVEPINGVMVSNFYHKAKKDVKSWGLPSDAIHPKEYQNLFKYLRIHPSEITEEHLIPFVPKAKEIDQDKDKRLYSIAKMLAEAGTVQAATTWILDHEEWDFTAVYLDSIDHFSHGFMNYHPPKMPNVSDKDFDMYKDVVKSSYRFHDMMLDELLKAAGEDATVLLLSDHGFHSGKQRPKLLPDEPAAPALQHRDYGIFCIKGPGIKKNEKIYGASLIDITPTILSLFDLPIGKDMNGKVLTDIYTKEPKLEYIPSWEKVEGDFATLDKEPIEDPLASQEAMKQLIDLGYIEDPGEDIKKATELTVRENRYNLARVYMGTNRYLKAIPLLEGLNKVAPSESRFALRLITSLQEVGEAQEALDLCEKHRVIVDELIVELGEQHTLGIEKLKATQDQNTFSENSKLLRKLKDAQKDIYRIDLLKSEILLKLQKGSEAIKILKDIEKRLPAQTSVLNKMGNAYIQIGEFNNAVKVYKKIISFDPENHIGHHGLAIAFIKLKSFEDAVSESLKTIELLYHYPLAHYHLGFALMKLEFYDESAKAFEVVLKMQPSLGKARNFLIEIYKNELNKPDLAKKHKKYFTQNIKNLPLNVTKDEVEFQNYNQKQALQNPIVIVSGLPRSGTSMMMQMLETGGLNVLVDDVRGADENNLKGYYEHEAVKRLASDKKWLPKAQNKVVKIVSHLLIHLPEKYNYKIVFMERDINEVIASQHKMLVNLGKAKESTYSFGLAQSFKENVNAMKNWANSHHNIEILSVNHIDVINNPLIESERIKTFLKTEINTEKMSTVVDKSMHRSKI